MDQWKRYYQELLTEDRTNFKEINYKMEHGEQTVRDITPHKVKTMKNNRSAGPGGIPIELIKNSPMIVIEILTEIFNDCLRGEEVPKEGNWLIFRQSSKKGMGKKECNNHRGISVTSSLDRLYGRILKMRIEDELEESEETERIQT